MFIHNLKYSVRTLLRNKMLVFWTIAFPLILGTFFKMAFSNIEKNEKLNIIDIAIVDNELFNSHQTFKEAFKTLGDQNNKERLFNITYTSLEEAKKLLEDDKITGYLELNPDAHITVNSSGINETILKFAVEEISQYESIMDSIIAKKYSENPGFMGQEADREFIENLYAEVMALASKETKQIKDISSKNLSYTMIEFYTLVAMACLYGGILAMVAINDTLPNMSSKGKRVSVAPTSKLSLVLSRAVASLIIQIIGIILLFIFTIFVLDVDFGDNMPLAFFLAFVGSLAGLAMGVAVASLFKAGENLKTGIILSITMIGSFFSGMMGITMKYIIDKNMPIINILNPANMITDGFYALYYYDTLDRFIYNIVSLLVFAGIMILLSVISLRRQKYDSI